MLHKNVSYHGLPVRWTKIFSNNASWCTTQLHKRCEGDMCIILIFKWRTRSWRFPWITVACSLTVILANIVNDVCIFEHQHRASSFLVVCWKDCWLNHKRNLSTQQLKKNSKPLLFHISWQLELCCQQDFSKATHLTASMSARADKNQPVPESEYSNTSLIFWHRLIFYNTCRLPWSNLALGWAFLQSHMTQLLLLGKFEYTGGPIFKVVLEC